MASLASVPAEILILIFTYLQCFADLTSVAGVCKDWRNAVHMRLRASQHEQPRYRQLPWLLQPSNDAPPSTITSFVSGTTGRRICLPEGMRAFCGSHEGGWVAIAVDRRGPYCKLVNLINQSSASIPLPNTLRLDPTHSEMVEIRMVTLSDVPTAKSCIAAAHIVGGCPSIIFCRPHVDCHWIPPLMNTELHCHWIPPLMNSELLQDTLYHRGEMYQGFYAVSNKDNLYVFLPKEINTGETLAMRQLAISFPPAPAMGKRMAGCTIKRYLVESRGKLLLVLRYSGRAMGLDLQTFNFRVFEMEINRPMPNGGHSPAWVELHGLDGRVITLATGCSRAFEAVQYKGFQGGSIYFLDDAAVGAGTMYSVFSSADLGMYSMGEAKIERPGLPSPALRGCLDGDGALGGGWAPRHPSQPQSCLYGPRELMFCTTHNLSHATERVTSRLQISSEIDHATNDEASSSTSAGGEQVAHKAVASVWPLLCKHRNYRPIWFLPPAVDEWLLSLHPVDA